MRQPPVPSTKAAGGWPHHLCRKPVKHGAVLSVDVEPIAQLWGLGGVLCLRAPYDALVQVCDRDLIVLGVEVEQSVVQALGGVVNRALRRGVQTAAGSAAAELQQGRCRCDGRRAGRAHRVVRVDDLQLLAFVLDIHVALWNGAARQRAVPVDPHCPHVH